MPADAATGVGSPLVGREVVAPRDVVVPAVVVALELEDALAAGERPREPDRVERRLGAGAAEDDPLGGRDHLDEPLGELDLERVGRRERHAVLVHRPHRGRVDPRVVVAEQDRPERRVEVDVLVAVDVPDARALRLGHEQRIWPRTSALALDAAGRDAAGALMQRGRGRPSGSATS